MITNQPVPDRFPPVPGNRPQSPVLPVPRFPTYREGTGNRLEGTPGNGSESRQAREPVAQGKSGSGMTPEPSRSEARTEARRVGRGRYPRAVAASRTHPPRAHAPRHAFHADTQ